MTVMMEIAEALCVLQALVDLPSLGFGYNWMVLWWLGYILLSSILDEKLRG